MLPEFELLGITFQTFGLSFAVAFVLAGLLLARRLKELGHSVDWAYEIIFAGLIGGLVGSRLYYIAQNYSQLDGDLAGALFSGSGLVWYGGALGGAAGVVIWAKLRGFLGLKLLDLTAPALALGYAIGRIGCQLSGDGDYGGPSDLPWAMAYPEGTVPTTEQVHPTPIYEFLAMGFVAWLLWRLRDRFRVGVLFAIYLVLSGLERFLVEFVRRNEAVLLGLTAPQLESVLLMLAGAVWIAFCLRNGGLKPSAKPATN